MHMTDQYLTRLLLSKLRPWNWDILSFSKQGSGHNAKLQILIVRIRSTSHLHEHRNWLLEKHKHKIFHHTLTTLNYWQLTYIKIHKKNQTLKTTVPDSGHQFYWQSLMICSLKKTCLWLHPVVGCSIKSHFVSSLQRHIKREVLRKAAF